MHPDLSQAIEAELQRLRASTHCAGDASIGVSDERDGWASLGATPLRGDFYWYGRADEILRRLRALPDAAGPEAVRSAFDSDAAG
jgi:hypothetical protein